MPRLVILVTWLIVASGSVRTQSDLSPGSGLANQDGQRAGGADAVSLQKETTAVSPTGPAPHTETSEHRGEGNAQREAAVPDPNATSYIEKGALPDSASQEDIVLLPREETGGHFSPDGEKASAGNHPEASQTDGRIATRIKNPVKSLDSDTHGGTALPKNIEPSDAPPKPRHPTSSVQRDIEKSTNFASDERGAKIVSKSNQLKKAHCILSSDMDRYMISPCDTVTNVVIQLSEAIVVDAVRLSNLEYYAAGVKELELYGKPPEQSGGTMDLDLDDDWDFLENFHANHTRMPQTFRLQEPTLVLHLKLRLKSWHPDESVCTMSTFEVYGDDETTYLMREIEKHETDMARSRQEREERSRSDNENDGNKLENTEETEKIPIPPGSDRVTASDGRKSDLEMGKDMSEDDSVADVKLARDLSDRPNTELEKQADSLPTIVPPSAPDTLAFKSTQLDESNGQITEGESTKSNQNSMKEKSQDIRSKDKREDSEGVGNIVTELVPISQSTLKGNVSIGANPFNNEGDWKFCATENATCAFRGTRPVRIGYDRKWSEETLTGPVRCTLDVFHDQDQYSYLALKQISQGLLSGNLSCYFLSSDSDDSGRSADRIQDPTTDSNFSLIPILENDDDPQRSGSNDAIVDSNEPKSEQNANIIKGTRSGSTPPRTEKMETLEHARSRIESNADASHPFSEPGKGARDIPATYSDAKVSSDSAKDARNGRKKNKDKAQPRTPMQILTKKVRELEKNQTEITYNYQGIEKNLQILEKRVKGVSEYSKEYPNLREDVSALKYNITGSQTTQLEALHHSLREHQAQLQILFLTVVVLCVTIGILLCYQLPCLHLNAVDVSMGLPALESPLQSPTPSTLASKLHARTQDGSNAIKVEEFIQQGIHSLIEPSFEQKNENSIQASRFSDTKGEKALRQFRANYGLDQGRDSGNDFDANSSCQSDRRIFQTSETKENLEDSRWKRVHRTSRKDGMRHPTPPVWFFLVGEVVRLLRAFTDTLIWILLFLFIIFILVENKKIKQSMNIQNEMNMMCIPCSNSPETSFALFRTGLQQLQSIVEQYYDADQPRQSESLMCC